MLYADLGFKTILDKVGNFQKLTESDGESFDSYKGDCAHSANSWMKGNWIVNSMEYS